MIYMLFDNPNDKATMNFIPNNDVCSINQVYPDVKCSSIKSMVSFSKEWIKKTNSDDTIVFWYDFMGVLYYWLCLLYGKRRKIIVLNILLKEKKTIKNKLAKILYRGALSAENVKATVTSREYGIWLNSYLGINADYTILHDVFHNQTLTHSSETESNSVFCGGRNGRDWGFLFEIAEKMPDVKFNCVMPESEYLKYEGKISENIDVFCDIPEKEFLSVLSKSKLMVMPLDTNAPAGLIAFFQAAENNKLIITTDTVTTREYFLENRGVLCTRDIEQWIKKIYFYLENETERNKLILNFKKYLESECSEKNYISVLSKLIYEKDVSVKNG